MWNSVKFCNCAFPEHFLTMKLGEITVFYAVILTETVLQRCSYEKVFWEYAAYLQENTYAEVWFQWSCKAIFNFAKCFRAVNSVEHGVDLCFFINWNWFCGEVMSSVLNSALHLQGFKWLRKSKIEHQLNSSFYFSDKNSVYIHFILFTRQRL